MALFLDPSGQPTFGLAICARCQRKFLQAELSPDPNYPGLMVCKEDRDQLDPYRLPPPPPDNLILPFVRPDVPLTMPPEGIPLTYEANLLFLRMDPRPNRAMRSIINEYIYTLVNEEGTWFAMDGLWPLAARYEQWAKLNWITGAYGNLTPVGDPTFIQNQGYQGDGVSAYLDSGWVPGELRYQRNSAHVAAWCLDAETGGVALHAGVGAVGPGLSAVGAAAGSGRFAINDFTLTAGGTAAASMRVAARPFNDTSLGLQDGEEVVGNVFESLAVPATTFTILGVHDGASLLLPTAKRVALASIGANLSYEQAEVFYQASLTYLTRIGAL